MQMRSKILENKVKLVVWDLDDTFWHGTLAEKEAIFAVDRNIELIRALSERGIINSICSKNDPEKAKAKLVEFGAWEYFVFPSISFSPKGPAVAEIIEGMALRAENVLFIDDNPSNLEEVKFYNPGIMAASPEEVLEMLLDHPSCIGKADPEMARLQQYKNLQRKFEERSTTILSNEEFLRASGIRVEIDYDVDANFDRVIELLNRTNQLNYTKNRVETPEALEELRSQLNGIAYYAGCVRAVDKYGDYGVIGFFLGKRRPRKNLLCHFVFSCRTMNMGIEQYVYEMLDKPEVDIVQPVSHELVTHSKIDWINTERVESGDAVNDTGKLVLLGGCDLLQLATYCSADRIEFVNTVKENVRIRYDDPSFILNDREMIRTCDTLRDFPWWTYEDAIRFDAAIAEAKLILLSLWFGMVGIYCRLPNGTQIRIDESLRRSVDTSKSSEWLDSNFEVLAIRRQEKLNLITESLEAIGKRSSASSNIFVLGCYTRALSEASQPEKGTERRVQKKTQYNDLCRDYCTAHSDQFHYVDVDTIIQPEHLVDNVHFTRHGYYALAQHILSVVEKAGASRRASQRPRVADKTLSAVA